MGCELHMPFPPGGRGPQTRSRPSLTCRPGPCGFLSQKNIFMTFCHFHKNFFMTFLVTKIYFHDKTRPDYIL